MLSPQIVYDTLAKDLDGALRANHATKSAMAIPGIIEAGWTMSGVLVTTGQGKQVEVEGAYSLGFFATGRSPSSSGGGGGNAAATPATSEITSAGTGMVRTPILRRIVPPTTRPLITCFVGMNPLEGSGPFGL
jgi:hypothetical protein